ncbi:MULTISPECIES: type II toxin-antitoxin system RelE/ParE family toxin [Klebsiella]|uniref:type II toxin-antitoxin system RelE/ParE family toxin n=1 Tax=Klebsiella TaxID=570 RepID=UPI0005EE7DB1|nr:MULTISPECIES: type II toxin-antitoxin system RelE/ParE family toxin [Klebsiella]KJO40249.1 cytoplasmic protein [Klebsiella aerogenes]KJO40691.1 cytoplasmic protein [Klebsiella aerogenes]KJO45200.1 cytoplasmic protein [Klebsiella aerogenes]MBZ4208531.1 type II toxin-antitoxin system RelE/ParE family toxin [Klebsiella aerogenes]MBZ4217035.1 type II toxin-antitoxin system RelE/ParE family toxin [Klebsiella aerogenes]
MLNQGQSLRSIVWMGSSFDDLRQFPEEVRRDAGFQLYRLQAGLEAADWKAMPQLGRCVEEIRLRHYSGAYRVIYLARFEAEVYVLHCFNKKTRRTAEHEKQIVRSRLQLIPQEHRSRK